MNYIVYKITRDDGQLYIGTTYSNGLKKRMKAHAKTDRFKGYTFDIEILIESSDYNLIMNQETYYISHYDTFYNGLNESIDGKGNHLCDTFTTKGYTYSDESRKKMSESAKKRVERDGIPFKGKCHTEETKNRLSCVRKGRRWSPTKLKIEDVEYILNLYHNIKPILEGDDILRKSGKPMIYDRAFATRYSKVFGVSLECILYIIRGKGWSDVQRKYTV